MIKVYNVDMSTKYIKKDLEEEINKCMTENKIKDCNIINATWKNPYTLNLICRED